MRLTSFSPSRTYHSSRLVMSSTPFLKKAKDVWEKMVLPKVHESQEIVQEGAIDLYSNIKGSILEVMARRMPNEMRLSLIEKWNLQSPKQISLNSVSQQSKPAENDMGSENTSQRSPVTEDFRDLRIEPEIDSFTKSPALDPILGKLVCDLGYKQVYVTSVERLAMAPVWEKQRILRPNRAIAIAQAKKSSKSVRGMPGVITLCR